MPTRDELLKELKAKAKRVVFIREGREGDQKYEVYRVYWERNGIMLSEAVALYIDSNGNAVWKDKLPSVLIPPPKRFNLDPNSLKIKALHMNIVEDLGDAAVIRVFEPTSLGTVTMNYYLVATTPDGSLKHWKIINYR